jgi:hypothetical protein
VSPWQGAQLGSGEFSAVPFGHRILQLLAWYFQPIVLNHLKSLLSKLAGF